MCRRRRWATVVGLLGLCLWALAGMVQMPVADAQTLPSRGASGLPLPRFVSIAATRANLRAGPGRQYPIDWVYVRAGTPLKVIAEFGQWRQVRDIDGTTGWMHKSLLSGRRTAVVVGKRQTVHAEPELSSRVVLYVDPRVVVELRQCGGGWCRIKVGDYSGWIPRRFLWGAASIEPIG